VYSECEWANEMIDHDILNVADNPPLVGESPADIDPFQIKRNGAGRLVANFLRSFFPGEWRPV
jgi:hypothetical protein